MTKNLENKATTNTPATSPVKEIKDTTSSSRTARKLEKMYKGEAGVSKLLCTLEFQRRANIWTPATCGELIVSMLEKEYIPEVVFFKTVEDNKEVLQIVDGQQRLTTVFGFMNNTLKLPSSTSSVQVNGIDVELAGKKFGELDDDVQDAIKDYEFSVRTLVGYTYEEAEKLFFKINSGVPLSPFQKAKAKVGRELLIFLVNQVKKDFYSQWTDISKAKKIKEAGFGALLQTMMLLDKYYVDGADIKSTTANSCLKYAIDIKNNYKDAQKARIEGVVDYLSESFTAQHKFLDPSNIQIVGLVASVAKDKGISPKEYGDFIVNFAEVVSRLKYDEVINPQNYHALYKKGGNSGNCSKEKIGMRIEGLLREFCKEFKCDYAEVVSSFKTSVPVTELETSSEPVEKDKADKETPVLVDEPKAQAEKSESKPVVGVSKGQDTKGITPEVIAPNPEQVSTEVVKGVGAVEVPTEAPVKGVVTSDDKGKTPVTTSTKSGDKDKAPAKEDVKPAKDVKAPTVNKTTGDDKKKAPVKDVKGKEVITPNPDKKPAVGKQAVKPASSPRK